MLIQLSKYIEKTGETLKPAFRRRWVKLGDSSERKLDNQDGWGSHGSEDSRDSCQVL